MSDENLLRLLRGDLESIRLAATSLDKSLAKCAKLTPEPRQSFEVEETFDALTSRFARTADILTQKVLKTTVLLLREDAPTFIDRMNLCEKLGMIPSAAKRHRKANSASARALAQCSVIQFSVFSKIPSSLQLSGLKPQPSAISLLHAPSSALPAHEVLSLKFVSFKLQPSAREVRSILHWATLRLSTKPLNH